MAEARHGTATEADEAGANSLARLTAEPYAGLHWQMTACERFALQDLLRRLSPDMAVEVGTYMGGSLQVLSRFCRDVVSVDIDPTVRDRLQGRFSNVAFRTGQSAELLPDILRSAAADGRHVGFVMIDGDHSAEGVRRDIEAVLGVPPTDRLVMLMHDSFNPECRRGIASARWDDCPYVQAVEVDFVPGIYHERAYDTAADRSMWGGFACAIVDAVPRSGPLEIRQSQRGLFEAIYAVSSHRRGSSPSLVRRIARRLKALLR